jgi:L-ribulose-5-phosphate 4-epimerase
MSACSHDLGKEIIEACLWLDEMGYVIGTYGNVSARVEEGLMITPSRIDYRALAAEDLVTVSLQGKVLEGSRLPSSELEVHRQIYVCRPDVGAIAHTHSLFATALSCLQETIPVIVEEQSQVVGGEIRCTRYVPAGQHRKLGEEVARALGQSNGVLIANHGTVSCGRTLEEAIFTCRIVERVAQMRVLAGACGKLTLIPREHVMSERERWLHKYGSADDRTGETL